VEQKIFFIEIYEIDIFEAKLGRLFATQIPDCLRGSAGDEPTVRQDNLLESFEDLPEPHILPQRDFQIVLRFQSHHRQFTPCSAISRIPTRPSSCATPKGRSDAHQRRRMRLRAAYSELFRRSGSNLSVPLSRMPAANREHLWDRRVLSTRKRQDGWRCHGLHSTVGQRISRHLLLLPPLRVDRVLGALVNPKWWGSP